MQQSSLITDDKLMTIQLPRALDYDRDDEGVQATVFLISDDSGSTWIWLEPGAFERGGQGLSIELSITHSRRLVESRAEAEPVVVDASHQSRKSQN